MRNCALALLLCLTGVANVASAPDPNQSRDRLDAIRKMRERLSDSAGSLEAAPEKLTGETLALLRVIIRQDMASDRNAAKAIRSDLAKDRVLPLARTSGDPNDRKQLRAIMADEACDPYKRFNAARVSAYLGDSQSADILSKVLQGKLVKSDSGREQNQAALCLLYLDYHFPEDFAFSRLPSPLYPELDALIDRPLRRIGPNPPYTREEVQAIVVKYIGLRFSVTVRGPLSIAEVEQESLLETLHDVVRHRLKDIPRVPFAYSNTEWKNLKNQLQKDDLIYYFTSDKTSWAALYGRAGYVAIRKGEVVAGIITKMN